MAWHFYSILFLAVSTGCTWLEVNKPKEPEVIAQADFRKFRLNYVLVWTLMMGKGQLSGHRPCQHTPYSHTDAGCLHCLLNFAPLRHLTGCHAAGDWLQGPYVYALYQQYGYQKGDIGKLFIAGFASSLVFGTFAGSLADK